MRSREGMSDFNAVLFPFAYCVLPNYYYFLWRNAFDKFFLEAVFPRREDPDSR